MVVAVRVRPFSRQECERNENVSAFEIDPATRSIVQRLSAANHRSRISSFASSSVTPAAAAPPPHFSFDRVFDSAASTEELYAACVKDIVDSAVTGMNGTVFAYGQTASGKVDTAARGCSASAVLSLLCLSLTAH